jgi:hypothetical protein
MARLAGHCRRAGWDGAEWGGKRKGRSGPFAVIAPLLVLALAACHGGASLPMSGAPSGQGTGNTPANAGVGVNAYLWRGALDTLSFMPLASEDPFGGVIMTDWYQPPSAPDERFRAVVYILGRQLRADGIRVALFHQVRGKDGSWQDAPVSKTTVGDIEAKILARARELRTAALAHGETD